MVGPLVHLLQPAASMRYGLLLLLVSSACNTDLANPPDAPPASVRERLEDQTRLMIKPPESAGAITAERRVTGGWQAGLVDLAIDSGELVVTANGDAITLGTFAVSFQPLEIPAAVFGGHPAQIEHLRVEQLHPLTATATWTDDNEARFDAMLELGLSWSLVIDGTHAPLGAPKLPPVPVEILLTGNGEIVAAELRAKMAGELWSWADLVRLSDLELILGAETPAPR
jgi:hypothetical protein